MEMAIHAGDVLLGKYKIERILGQGGMGVVVAARHMGLDELFAIKFLLPQALENHMAMERFLREARASAQLKGEHVAKVHDVGQFENGAPYMIMEYLEGCDLKALILQQGALSVVDALMYVLQACEAIAEAHARGIIHRDIKPANLFLIRRPNGSACVKVLDFGISKQTTTEELNLTRTGTLLGSPFYMSPEQMARTKDIDTRSDVWSMGAVLYELLTGQVPFGGQTLTEVVARVLQTELVPPRQLRSYIPPALDAVVVRCLQKHPDHRFQRVVDLATALRDVLPAHSRLERLPSIPESPPPPLEPRTPLPSDAEAQAPLPGSVTTAAWGKTGAKPPNSRRAGIVLLAMGSTFAVSALGGALWFGLRQLPAPPTSEEPPSVSPATAPVSPELVVPMSSELPPVEESARPPAFEEPPPKAEEPATPEPPKEPSPAEQPTDEEPASTAPQTSTTATPVPKTTARPRRREGIF